MKKFYSRFSLVRDFPHLKTVAEWAGCATGMAGAGLLALHSSVSRWGFALFLLSNAFMFLYGYITKANGIILMQIGFTVTSITGISNWFFK